MHLNNIVMIGFIIQNDFLNDFFDLHGLCFATDPSFQNHHFQGDVAASRLDRIIIVLQKVLLQNRFHTKHG